jgi:nuclear transport factor 2 (NTF2) superfamily protein
MTAPENPRPPFPPLDAVTAAQKVRIASINDLPIQEKERKYHWPLGRRTDDHPNLSELGS